LSFSDFSMNIFLIKFVKLKENLTVGTKECLYNTFKNMFNNKPHYLKIIVSWVQKKNTKPENNQCLDKTHLLKWLHCQFIVFQYLQYSTNTEKFWKLLSLNNHMWWTSNVPRHITSHHHAMWNNNNKVYFYKPKNKNKIFLVNKNTGIVVNLTWYLSHTAQYLKTNFSRHHYIIILLIMIFNQLNKPYKR